MRRVSRLNTEKIICEVIYNFNYVITIVLAFPVYNKGISLVRNGYYKYASDIVYHAVVPTMCLPIVCYEQLTGWNERMGLGVQSLIFVELVQTKVWMRAEIMLRKILS